MKKADKLYLTLKGYEPWLITAISRYMDATGREMLDALDYLNVDLYITIYTTDAKFNFDAYEAQEKIAFMIDLKRLGK